MLCGLPPPSDHDCHTAVPCDTAKMLWLDPTIVVCVSGAVPCVVSYTTCCPLGTLSSVICTSCACSDSDAVPVSPALFVAVSCSSRKLWSPWSGTWKLPLAPVLVVSTCVWQVPPGQWWMMICQLKLFPDSVPSTGSVADPL